MREAQARFRFMAEATGIALYRLRYSTMAYDYLSPTIEQLTGYSPSEVAEAGFGALVETVEAPMPGASELSRQELEQRRLAGQTDTYRAVYLVRRKDGSRCWLEDQSVPWRGEDGELLGSVGVLQDVSERKAAEEERDRLLENELALRRRAEALHRVSCSLIARSSLGDLLENVVVSLADALGAHRVVLYALDPDERRVTHCVQGGSRESVPEASFDELWNGLSGWVLREGKPALSPKGTPDPRESPEVRGRRAELGHGSLVVAPLLYQERVLGTLTVINAPADPDFTDADVALMMTVANQTAVAIEQQKSSTMLSYQARHDALTGLPNRLLFEDRLDQAIRLARRQSDQGGDGLALFFIDLDRFKVVNDTLGHAVGDRLLQAVAQRFTACVRQSDTLARMGGDEFTLIVPATGTSQDAATVASKLLGSLEAPLSVDGHELFVSASIGISLYPQDGDDAATLQRNADAAMYRAKASGAHGYRFFQTEMNASALGRLALENGLRRAVDRGELVLYYHLQYCLRTGRALSAEALLRWRHPELGLISPGTFIPIAEESGLIVPIGRWVLEEACRQARVWQEEGRALQVAVNVSARQFSQPDFARTVAEVLDASGLEASLLELELTESLIMDDVRHTSDELARLRALGISLAIDDFGTAYSSLAYLQRLPVDCLKIDQSFVRGIGLSPRAGNDTSVLVQAVVALAHNLGLGVLAEGVETQGQLDFLRGVACDKAQDYHFARPLPAQDVWRIAVPRAVPGAVSGVVLAGEPLPVH